MQNFENFALHVQSPQRPRLITHHSSSLPSTPYQHARKLSDEIRIPSPIQGTENSPSRSAHSESDSTLRPPGRSTFLTGCKYETGMAFSRRRIPYSEGGEKLDRATSMPKKYLDPKEEGKLSGDMRELYDRLLPSRESEERRASFVQKLDHLLNDQWPGNKIKVHVFGSSGNMLCTSDSDVDICITTPMKALERVCLLAKALAENGMERVVCVPHAKVPIVKIWDPELQLACDLNVNNTLALENTRMIKTYVEIDERVRPLAMTIKHWTRRRVLNDAALGGTLSSYTWICMIINFLQTRNPKILPSLHKRPHQRKIDSDGNTSTFADDIESLRGFGKENQETIGELLFHFFRRYAHEIDFDRNVISVREGQLISKQAKKWHLLQNNRLCVEEPFNTDRNLGNTVDDTSFRGVHKELRKAFDLVSEGKLAECCEQYVFPPAAQTVWAKPPPQPRPVLSRSVSQSGRSGRGGGNNVRGGRQHQGQNRTGQSNRRASSAAVLNKPNGSPAGLQNSTNGFQIHDQLYNQYQFLQAQEAQLRLHLHNRAQAQLQAHTQTTVQMQSLKTPGSPYPQFLNSDGPRRQISNDSVPLSAPLRQMAFFYSMPYTSKPPKVATNLPPQQGIQTNPSSPSMTPVQPVHPELRRSLHRSQADHSSIAALRSHSQPASAMRFHPQPSRPMPANGANPLFQGTSLGISNMQQYQHMVQNQLARPELHHLNTQLEGSMRYSSPLNDLQLEDTTPKEYVGYYVHDSPPPRPYRHTLIAPIPPYNDLVQRARGVSPDLTRLRHASRSPSPSSMLSQRDRSISFHSAGSCLSSTPTGSGGFSNWAPPRRSGPIIANGSSDASLSDYATPPETRAFPPETSEAASLSDEPMDTPLTASVTPSQDIHDSFMLDPSVEPGRASTASTMLQFGDFPARSTFRASTVLRPDSAVPTNKMTPKSSCSPPVAADEKRNDLETRREPVPSHNPLNTEHKVPNGVSVQANVISNIDASLSQPEISLVKPSKPLPHLSPVREVRTPSPVALRREDTKFHVQNKSAHGRSVSMSGPSPLSSISNSKQHQVEMSSTKMNGHPSNGSPNGHPTQSSGWQQTGRKGRKNKGKAAKGVAAGSGANEEVVNGGERKGG